MSKKIKQLIIIIIIIMIIIIIIIIVLNCTIFSFFRHNTGYQP